MEYLNLCGGLKTLGEIEEFISDRLKFFYDNGCRISDHSLDYVPFEKGASPEAALEKALKGEPASKAEADSYKTHLLLHCAKLYKKYNITMQIHYGAMRNNNTHMFNRLGPDTGFDSIGESLSAHNLSRLIDSMSEDAENSNPKIILYSLHPNDFYMLATMTGNFRNIQFGSAWWFNDQLDGMTSQMKALANLGALNKFVGMLTDSRSFPVLSTPRIFQANFVPHTGRVGRRRAVPCGFIHFRQNSFGYLLLQRGGFLWHFALSLVFYLSDNKNHKRNNNAQNKMYINSYFA